MGRPELPLPAPLPVPSPAPPALPLAGFRRHLERARAQNAASELFREPAPAPRPARRASRPRCPRVPDRIGRPYLALVRC